ncbi:MAG: alpha-2-macroglobulin [Filomicrobium sp.]
MASSRTLRPKPVYSLTALLGAALLALIAALAVSPADARDKPFAHQDVERQAKNYETYLKRFKPEKKVSVSALLKRGTATLKKDPRAASRIFAIAVAANPKSSQAWLGLAKSLLAYDPKTLQNSEHYNVPRNASGAAYRAYQNAKGADNQAEALDVLTNALIRRSLWRPAIEAMKVAVGLEETAPRAKRLADLKAQHGFRMTDYKTESDSAEPRVCLEFSERLSRSVEDFSDYVTVNGADPQSVKAERARLCIGGLTHGERYQIKLRAGLPSDIGEKLIKTVDVAAYVPDRKPSVRFTGRAYVLPSRGQQGIPLVTINTDSVNVEVFRIGDRSLIETLDKGDLGSRLSQWQIENLKKRKGEKIYNGTLEVGTKLNAEVTTAFPVSDAIETLQPGVYAMTAKPTKRKGSDPYQLATQWFIVSDLGLTAFTGDDGIHAFVRSLDTAAPAEGTSVKLVARNNEVLAEAKTDARGYARFDAALTRGEGGLQPAILVARNGTTDYAFLELTTAAFDLTDRGVKGRNPSGPIDAYVYTERGVYRPGENVHLTALVRDAAGRAAGLPVTLIISRPDGVEHRRIVMKDQGLGGRTSLLALSGGAMTGTWRAKLHVDPKQTAISEAAFLVEDFVPERLDMTLAKKSEVARRGETFKIDAKGRFLYGPPAADLALEGEVIVRASNKGVPGHKGFLFGQADEFVSPARVQLSGLPHTGANGEAFITGTLPKLKKTAKPLEAKVIVRLAEPGGRTIERTTTLPVDLGLERIGIKPLFDVSRLREGNAARFEVIRLGANGKTKSVEGLRWTLKRLETTWQWYSRNGSWTYEPVTIERREATGELKSADEVLGKIEAAVTYGRYRLEVSTKDAEGPASSVAFNAGWFTAADRPDSPEILDVALDKATYKKGDTAKLRIATRLGGRALVAVLGGTMHTMQEVDIPNGGGSVEIAVGEDWGPGAYATALLYRPMNKSAKRMPQRALGLTYLALDQTDAELKIRLDAPEKVKSGTTLSVPMTVEGLTPGEPARVTLAAVDVGILNLTGFRSPAPETWFNAQTKLGTEIRDFYGRLIDGMRAERGALRSGGDADSGLAMSGTPPVEATLAEFSGIVEVDAQGKATVSFDLPDFNGSVRLMAVAWSKDKVGHAVGSVIVRDALALTVAAPRFMTLGDEVQLGFGLHNIEGPKADYALSVVQEVDDGITNEIENRKVALDAGQRVSEKLTMKPKSLGLKTYNVAVTGPNGINVKRQLKFDVKAPAGDIRRTTVSKLKAGGSVELTSDLIADLIPERSEASISIGPAARFDVAGLIQSLDRYPYGCAEQTVSKALPLVYAQAVSARSGVEMEPEISKNVQKAIDRVFEMQDSSGAFGAWGPSSTNIWLTSYVTDFLTRAREGGYKVDARGFNSALDRLANFIAYAQDFKSGGGEPAYALYVLARNGRAPMGELRYYHDARLDRFSTPIAKAQLGSALALMGDRERASTAFSAASRDLLAVQDVSQTGYRTDYGSWLRDGAALLALASETGMAPAAATDLADRVADAALADTYTSTQEQAWLLLAIKAMGDTDKDSALKIGETTYKAPLTRVVTAAQLKANALKITNASAKATDAVISVVGAAVTPEPATANGFDIERSFYRLDGTPVNLASANGGASTVKQNERFIVVVKATTKHRGGRVLLVDKLPAGLEVENPRLVSSGDVRSLSWLKNDVFAEHTEFRDDRVVSAFNLYGKRAAAGQSVSIAYIVRAVTPGSFVHPAATVEDMYAPERHARTDAGRLTVVAN